MSVTKNSDSKIKHNRAKSSSSQNRNNSTNRRNNQKEQNSSKKPNKRRTKSETSKTVVSPIIVSESKSSNEVQVDSPSIDTPKNKRRSRQKPRQHIHSDEIDKQSIHQSTARYNGNVNYNSRSNSRVTRRDYIDRQDFDRDVSVGHKVGREYVPSLKKYYSQSRHRSYSQERPYYGSLRSNSRVQQYDSNRSVVMPQNRYTNGPVVRQTRYFNGPMVRHNSYNGQASSRQMIDDNHRPIRHNGYSNEPLSRQNSFYDGIISHRNSFSKGPGPRQDGYTNSRVFRLPLSSQYRNGMASQTNEVKLIN